MTGKLSTGQRLEIRVDTPACSGCRLCEMVCSLYHEGVVNLEKARIRISDNYAESLYEPHICQLCEPPDCVATCLEGALTQAPETGVIVVDNELCTGCIACVGACPYDAIRWSEELERLFVCDRCGGQSLCIQFCTSGALNLVEAG